MPLSRSSGVWDVVALGVRRGASNGERPPRSLGGRPWTLVGSSGTWGRVWAEAMPSSATLLAAAPIKERRVRLRWRRLMALYPKIRLAYALVAQQTICAAFQHHVARLENVAASRSLECRLDVLFDDQDGHALGVQPLDRLHQRFDNHRRQAERQLVDHQQLRTGHDAAGDRDHLLL